MIVLDTNVISVPLQRASDPTVMEWLDRQPLESLWTTSVTLFEVRVGIELLPKGRRRGELENAFAEAIDQDFNGCILPFDRSAALTATVLAASQRRQGRSLEVCDVQIAGIVAARRATGDARHPPPATPVISRDSTFAWSIRGAARKQDSCETGKAMPGLHRPRVFGEFSAVPGFGSPVARPERVCYRTSASRDTSPRARGLRGQALFLGL